MTGYQLEPSSFRDRGSRVFHHKNVVFRGLTTQALQDWKALAATRFFQHYRTTGRIIHTERVTMAAPQGWPADGKWTAILKHQTIPFVSYPYEWSFGMLKDAALLQLELLDAALDEDMSLKDASPFNVQWHGALPVFIDIGSFEQLTPHQPWDGYRQFCQLFLYPLFLQAYKDVPFQPWLRSNLDGIDAEQCVHLMSLRDLLRPGVFLHAYMQHKLQSRYAGTKKEVKQELGAAGFNKTLLKGNVGRLRTLVEKLSWKRVTSNWSDYADTNTYTDQDQERKAAFVRKAVMAHPWRLVWDLGCNIGNFSRIAGENADSVVALDADHLTIERLYQALKTEGNTKILPLVNNVTNPSPNLGWRGLERKALVERGRPNLMLCLALLHHIVISGNIPVSEFISWLAELRTALVIEFVARNDPMVQTLLRNKRDQYDDYHQASFEYHLNEAFNVTNCEPLASGTRVLYYGAPKRP